MRYALFVLLITTTVACAATGELSPNVTPPPTPTTSSPPVTPTPTIEIIYSDQAVFEAELDKPFGLKQGQTAVIPSEQLEITYVRVVEDTRCPGGVDCEWRGELVIEYEVVKRERSLGLFTLGSNSVGQVIDNYVVTIWDYDGETVMVQPYVEETERVTSADVPANCNPGETPLSTYTNPDPTTPEIHVIGVYHTGRWPGVANIYIEREDVPLILVLSAYEPTVWRVHPSEGVIIEQIILNGYGQHQAVGVDEVPAVDRSGGYGESYIVATAYRWGADDTQTLVTEIETMSGQPIMAFYGCYEASEFTIP